MDFSLSSEQKAFKHTVNLFAKNYMEPYASEWDENKTLPADVLKEAAKIGLASIYVPEILGGTGLTAYFGLLKDYFKCWVLGQKRRKLILIWTANQF